MANAAQIYKQIVESVNSEGFHAFFETIDGFGDRVVCVSHCREGRYYGTSFWITQRDQTWFLGAFSYRQWILTGSVNLPALAVDYLKSGSGPGGPSAELVCRYKLRELNSDELIGSS
ncbi:MAG: hypothetical protein IAG10_28180 [Planctomycetaceae bacterium]|nr:hypothetical protein [Planctomycetaceae bacterium]